MTRQQSIACQALINLSDAHRKRVILQDLRVDTQVIGDDFSNPQEVRVSAIKLVLTGPTSSGHDQAGDLFGGEFFRIDDDIEIAAIIDIDPITSRYRFRFCSSRCKVR